ncbi:MAG: deoxyribodipyrimidine photo-lyase [Planctomycetota bacterium]|jgi:deoxyribodipyrimidine photo-lyase
MGTCPSAADEKEMTLMVLTSRITAANEHESNPQGIWVLYWMTSARRTGWNYGLQRALGVAEKMGKPLLVLEGLQSDYPHACDRFHAFVLNGMADNAKAFKGSGVTYFPYVEGAPGEGRGLFRALASLACHVVGDEFPTGPLRSMVPKVLAKVTVKAEMVDSNGILPLSSSPKAFTRAYDFRRFFQRILRDYIDNPPLPDPLRHFNIPACPPVPLEILEQWAPATKSLLKAKASDLAVLPIDHSIAPTSDVGGAADGTRVLSEFVDTKLSKYADDRNHPDKSGSSELSPYLHFGHVAAWQVLQRVVEDQNWTPHDLGESCSGAREGWWGLAPEIEAFFDQVFVWREVGYHYCRHVDNHDQFESLPEWAKASLFEHTNDERPYTYDLEALDQAKTMDPLWNAAQRQLVKTGRMHNYLRMLWGKKILEWSPTPIHGFENALLLNDRYALDGRDPNSISGVSWCFGRFDRAWGPERPIFGKIRYMTSQNTMRKLRLKEFMKEFTPTETSSEN